MKSPEGNAVELSGYTEKLSEGYTEKLSEEDDPRLQLFFGSLPDPCSDEPSICWGCEAQFPTNTGLIIVEPFLRARNGVWAECRYCSSCTAEFYWLVKAQVASDKDCPHVVEGARKMCRYWSVFSGEKGEKGTFLCDACFNEQQTANEGTRQAGARRQALTERLKRGRWRKTARAVSRSAVRPEPLSERRERDCWRQEEAERAAARQESREVARKAREEERARQQAEQDRWRQEEAERAEARRQARREEIERQRQEEREVAERRRQALAESMARVLRAKGDPTAYAEALHEHRRLAVELDDIEAATWAKAQLRHLRPKESQCLEEGGEGE